MGNLYIARWGTEPRLHGAIYICSLSACQVCLKQHQLGVTPGPVLPTLTKVLQYGTCK